MTKDDIEHPIMPTGSGVADLMVAREQDALDGEAVDAIAPPEQVPLDDAASGTTATDLAESEGHPS